MSSQFDGTTITASGRESLKKSDVALTVSSVEHFDGVMAFSLRTGGCSPAPLDTLNFSQTQGDSAANVRHNLRRLSDDLNIDPSRITICRQVHGNTVAIVDSVPEEAPEADAVVTDRIGVFPAIRTADCLPILLLDPVKQVAAAIHAGWRGTVLRITRDVLRLMEHRFHCRPSDIVAALGPAIETCCYEVDDAVLVPFRLSIPDADRFITRHRVDEFDAKGGRESFRIDLAGANRFELTAHGVPEAHIIATGLCTSCHSELFFSHRRDGTASGRHIAITGFRR